MHLHLCMVRFNKNEKENRNMREKVLAVCTRVNEKVDYTRTDLIDGGYIDSVTLVEIASELMDEFVRSRTKKLCRKISTLLMR